MFGDLIFAFIPFGSYESDQFIGTAWANDCITESQWSDSDVSNDNWSHANIENPEWVNERVSVIPTRRCK